MPPSASIIPDSFCVINHDPVITYCRITMDIIKTATVKEKKIMIEEDPLLLLIFCIRLQRILRCFVLIASIPFQNPA